MCVCVCMSVLCVFVYVIIINSKQFEIKVINLNTNIIHTFKWFQVFLKNTNIAQSAGAVEYTDCASAEG